MVLKEICAAAVFGHFSVVLCMQVFQVTVGHYLHKQSSDLGRQNFYKTLYISYNSIVFTCSDALMVFS